MIDRRKLTALSPSCHSHSTGSRPSRRTVARGGRAHRINLVIECPGGVRGDPSHHSMIPLSGFHTNSGVISPVARSSAIILNPRDYGGSPLRALSIVLVLHPISTH